MMSACISLIPVFHAIATTLYRGFIVFQKAGINFLTTLPPSPISRTIGGVAPALLGSFVLLALSLPVSTLVGLLLAIFVNEFPRFRIAAMADAVARAFASVPTIVVSMTVYSLVVVLMRRYTAIAGSLALTIVSLPYAYTGFYSVLSSVPHTYREAAYSIGMTRWMAIWRVIVPIARRGVAVTLLLVVNRILGETAALLFTAGRQRLYIALSPLEPVDALPLLIFDYALSPYRIFHEVAWGAAAILMMISLMLFAGVKLAVKGVRL